MHAAKDAFFELCAESLDAARAAESGGADRIELCAELACGGLTPARELIAASVGAVSIPVFVLIRPRAGDFVFSVEEFALMWRQIVEAKLAGASGVAVGALRADGQVDVERMRVLVTAARPMAVTFHRAFDEAANLDQALEEVIATGADSLLTSGGAADVLAGAESIARLSRRAGGRIRIVAGGGLRLSNLVDVVRRSGAFALHGSLTRDHGGAEPGALAADVRTAVRLLKQEFDEIGSAVR